MKPLISTRNVLLACSIALLTGCGSSSAADTTKTATSSTAAIAAMAISTQPLTTTEIDMLLFVREEEKLARDVYLTLNDRYGQKVFENIATKAEQQHMDVMGTLVARYNLVDPVTDNTVGVFTDPALLGLYQDLVMRGSTSLLAALNVGGFIEEYDINDLQEAIDEAKAGSNPADIILAYENLMCGSRNHLRAFVGQVQKNNATYTAQLLPQASVDAIVATSEEQCGQ